jgi:hypothetical protein
VGQPSPEEAAARAAEAAAEKVRYEQLKVEFQGWTLGIGLVGGIGCYYLYGTDVAISFALGASSGLQYLRLLSRSVDAGSQHALVVAQMYDSQTNVQGCAAHGWGPNGRATRPSWPPMWRLLPALGVSPCSAQCLLQQQNQTCMANSAMEKAGLSQWLVLTALRVPCSCLQHNCCLHAVFLMQLVRGVAA